MGSSMGGSNDFVNFFCRSVSLATPASILRLIGLASQWYPKTELKYDTGRVCEGRPLSALPWGYDRQEKVTSFKVAARIRCRGAFFGHAAAASSEGLILP